MLFWRMNLMRPSYLLALAPVALMLNAFAAGCTSGGAEGAVSYTHLTLPTIYSV